MANVFEWRKRVTWSFEFPLWQEQDHECWEMLVHSVEQGCHSSLGLWAAAGLRLSHRDGFSVHQGGRVSGERQPPPSNIHVFLHPSWETFGTCRIPCQQQPRLRHWLTMNPLGFPVKLIAADYSWNQTDYFIAIIKNQFQIHIKIETYIWPLGAITMSSYFHNIWYIRTVCDIMIHKVTCLNECREHTFYLWHLF